MAENRLLVPFLNKSPVYCYGVELGMQVISPMLRKEPEIRGYFRTENEEQIRLCCYRMGYDVTELKPWRRKRKPTGWVWMLLTLKPELVSSES